MSFRAVTWAFDTVRGLSATEKLVLLALAEFANDEDITWRSREEIAARAECSERTVERALKTLGDRGLISLSPRYAWCDSESGSCATRSPHQHRRGTTYLLHLDYVGTDSQSHQIPTSAKLADVAKTAETQGNLHTRQIGGCGTSQVSTPDTGDAPHPTQVAAIRSVNPQLNPQPDQPSSSPVREHSRSVGQSSKPESKAAAPIGAAPPVVSDGELAQAVALVTQCLPRQLQVLDRKGFLDVAVLLRERLDAGWEPSDIRKLMNQPLPAQVGRLAGIVSFRLRENVATNLAPLPAQRQQTQRAIAAERVKPPHEIAWDENIWEPAYQLQNPTVKSAPRDLIEAAKNTELMLKHTGLNVTTWPGFWSEAVLEHPQLDPEDPKDRATLAIHARQLAAAKHKEPSHA